jgi:hypothetical protein
MMSTPPRGPTPLRDVLYELALAQPAPDAALVDAFARRYPEYTDDLTAYAIELALDAIAAPHEPLEMPEATTIPSVARAMRRFQTRLSVIRQATGVEAANAAAVVANPFAMLTRAGMRALAQRLHANTVFIMKLRDRLIAGDTMTEGFIRRLAEELGVLQETVVAHFAAPASVLSTAYFKADTKPEAGEKQTFEDAIRSCGLTPAQQTALLQL